MYNINYYGILTYCMKCRLLLEFWYHIVSSKPNNILMGILKHFYVDMGGMQGICDNILWLCHIDSKIMSQEN